jgi:anhydro-N-acetylmuramic acid kinase
MLSIGLMSGTSMDAIDAALLQTDGSANHVIERGHTTLPYAEEFKVLLKAAESVIRQFVGDLQAAEAHYPLAVRSYLVNELGITEQAVDLKNQELSAYLYGETCAHIPLTLSAVIHHSTELHGHAVNQLLVEFGYVPEQIDVVGYHGQCMLHQPKKKISVIVGHGQVLANQINITVVNDFRRRDIEAGGLGAPFAPLYHQALAIKDNKMPVAVVNCGGISNITLINGPNENDLLAYDTGPGNGLIDRLVRQRTQGKENMDLNGLYGLQGEIHEEVIDALYQQALTQDGENYFLAKPPKSLDIGDMQLIPELEALSLEDACATLEAFTARMIVKSLDLLQTTLPRQWILAGGGWNNPVISREFRACLAAKLGNEISIQSADEAGWNSQALEAQIFAYFAVRSLQNKPLSVFGTTQVPVPVSGGRAHIPAVGTTAKVKELIALNPQVLQS